MKKTKYSETVINLPTNEIIELYRDEKKGSTYIAEKFKCKSQHILKILKENKVPIYKRSTVDKEEVRQLHDEGYSLRQIAEKVKVNKNLVSLIVQEIKSSRKRPLRNIIKKEKLLELSKQNLTMEEMAKIFKTSSMTVSRYLKRFGIKKKYAKGRIVTIGRGMGTYYSKIDKINQEECAKLYQEGYSYAKLNKKYNIGRDLIKKILMLQGVELRKRKINENGAKPAFNEQSTFFFENFDKLNNTKGLYGENEYYTEELNYFPDYINFDLKLIIEWDEKHHQQNKLKDTIREKEIREKFPDFEFKRISE